MSYRARNWVRTLPLHRTPKAVLIELADRAGSTDYCCFPGQDRLAADAGLSSRTVWSALTYLEAEGLITRTYRARPDGRRNSDLIEVLCDDGYHGPRLDYAQFVGSLHSTRAAGAAREPVPSRPAQPTQPTPRRSTIPLVQHQVLAAALAGYIVVAVVEDDDEDPAMPTSPEPRLDPPAPLRAGWNHDEPPWAEDEACVSAPEVGPQPVAVAVDLDEDVTSTWGAPAGTTPAEGVPTEIVQWDPFTEWLSRSITMPSLDGVVMEEFVDESIDEPIEPLARPVRAWVDFGVPQVLTDDAVEEVVEDVRARVEEDAERVDTIFEKVLASSRRASEPVVSVAPGALESPSGGLPATRDARCESSPLASVASGPLASVATLEPSVWEPSVHVAAACSSDTQKDQRSDDARASTRSRNSSRSRRVGRSSSPRSTSPSAANRRRRSLLVSGHLPATRGCPRAAGKEVISFQPHGAWIGDRVQVKAKVNFNVEVKAKVESLVVGSRRKAEFRAGPGPPVGVRAGPWSPAIS